MHLIALTGGIASGKSTVAQQWAKQGAAVVDADALAREVVEPGSPVLAEIAERFGSTVLSPDGSLNRAALGAFIFSDREAREALNRITHPAIGRLAQSHFDEAARVDPDAIVVYDIPLLVESAQSLERFALVVTVEAEPEVRVQRLVEHRGMTASEAERRVASQASSRERRAVADFVIDAGDSLADTRNRADAVWESIRSRLHGAL
ncbi:dephospho-CoA kinase [Salinibacterium sp. PAMC 21357]|uniref:dephospho-CoA kinase n=1 Tax=Salinibacterium sp. PAMC 21357 TaxID=1112215 RepID=UPI000287B0AD|nr:dephospho-CoA kinase [Salinibacterium sp. PAMC 21357]